VYINVRMQIGFTIYILSDILFVQMTIYQFTRYRHVQYLL